VQHPPPNLFVPVKAGVTPPAGQNIPFLREAVQAKAITDGVQTTSVNPFRRVAKGSEKDTQNFTFKAMI